MDENKWTLGEDLVASDNLLDPVTFDDLIMAVHCDCKEITPEAVNNELNRIIELRLCDMYTLLENSMDAIISEAKKGR